MTHKKKNSKRISSQVMELKDLLAGPLVATVEADSISAHRYLECLLALAFESHDPKTGEAGHLRTLDFTYRSHDVNGPRLQHIRIPLLTLVPLPLLQVKEAEFDFDLLVVDAQRAEPGPAFPLRGGSSASEEETAPEGVKLRVAMAPSIAESTSTNTQQHPAANMKVKVRMQQADMPGGLSNLLHLTTNNLLMEEVEPDSGIEKERSDGNR